MFRTAVVRTIFGGASSPLTASLHAMMPTGAALVESRRCATLPVPAMGTQSRLGRYDRLSSQSGSIKGSRQCHSERALSFPMEEGDQVLDKGITVMDAARVVASSDVMQSSNDAFYIVDLNEVKDMFRQWQTLIPRVQPYYAVKCNPDPWILRTLAELGAGFDCATPAEIEAVREAGAGLSDFSTTDRVLYAHPIKQPSHIQQARSLGVSMMTFDNVDELHKIATLHPGAELIVRLLPDDSSAACQFGKKFGASLEDLPAIMQAVQQLDLNLVGVSYHIGSGPSKTQPFSDAVTLAREAFDLARSFGIELKLLDIGGGFPGSSWDLKLETKSNTFFEEVADVLCDALDEHFPKSSGVRIVSEPGRYMVHSSHTLAATVIGKRVTELEDGSKQFRYYLNDGLYGSFNCILYDHATVEGAVLDVEKGGTLGPLFTSSVWGPTCDGLDCIHASVELPEMLVGDRMCYPNMGAYTIAAGSTFNGFPKPRKCYLV